VPAVLYSALSYNGSLVSILVSHTKSVPSSLDLSVPNFPPLLFLGDGLIHLSSSIPANPP
jgi:hypothetical protein